MAAREMWVDTAVHGLLENKMGCVCWILTAVTKDVHFVVNLRSSHEKSLFCLSFRGVYMFMILAVAWVLRKAPGEQVT